MKKNSQKNIKKNLTNYDLCVRAIFEEINRKLQLLVDGQKKYQFKSAREAAIAEKKENSMVGIAGA